MTRLGEARMLIGGKLCDADKRLAVVNPASGRKETSVPAASVDDVEAAVVAAQAALPAWDALGWDGREDLLARFVDGLRGAREEILEAVCLELGKSGEEAGYEPDVCAWMLESFLPLRLEDEIIEDSAGRKAVLTREPLGVVAGIGSWNAPAIITTQKIAPALLAGNTVIYKPSPHTPLSALVIAKVAAGILPAGVLNVLPGDDAIGRALVEHPGIAKVSFTGSTRAGREIMASSGATLKRLTLELGGHNAGIVLDDADIEAIAMKVYFGAFLNNGQICTALRRLYVPARLYAPLRDALCAIVSTMPPAPIQNARQFEVVQEMVGDALEQGAQAACGGRAPGGPGFHFPVTILENLPGDASLARQECFGPVLAIHAYEDLEEANAAANDSEYGLGASVWSGDLARAGTIARRLRAGTVWINCHADVQPSLPMAPAGQSGIGVEFTAEGLKEFTQIKLINCALGSTRSPEKKGGACTLRAGPTRSSGGREETSTPPVAGCV